MAVYQIKYDEPDVSTYKGVDISYGQNQKKIFNSGNFIKDWYDLMKFIITELGETEPHFVGSSCVDHFFMDGADKLYDESYLVFHEQAKEHILYYGRVREPQEGIKFYVLKGTQPTWKELKKMCEL